MYYLGARSEGRVPAVSDANISIRAEMHRFLLRTAGQGLACGFWLTDEKLKSEPVQAALAFAGSFRVREAIH
jgi:hypothetical protein